MYTFFPFFFNQYSFNMNYYEYLPHEYSYALFLAYEYDLHPYVKRVEKCASGKCSLNSKVATELYLFPEEKENIDKTLKAMERGSSQPFPGSGVDYVRGRY